MDKILVVEDEVNIREFILLNLKLSSFKGLEAPDGETAIEILKNEPVDLVLLDVNLPGKNGFEICKYIKENYPEMAVIMVTANSQDMDKIMGLEIGADDYVIKPFNPMELVARIRSVLRRLKKPATKASTNTLTVDELSIDFSKHLVTLDGNEIKLTPKEYELLALLASRSDTMFSRDELMNLVWGNEFFGDPKTVDVHVRRLREKIEKDPKNPKFIETVWGTGYRWRNN